MKSGVRQVHVRQHQDQHEQKQHAHQNRQARRTYRPTLHGTEGNTDFRDVKPHERAIWLRLAIVGNAQTHTARNTTMLASS
jgi:hypothetical protein